MKGDHDCHCDALVLTTIQKGFNDPTFSDITTRSKTATYYCHKLVLSSRGEGGWLKALENRNHLDYSSLEDAAVSRLLKWIYLKNSLVVSSSDSRESVLEILEATKLVEEIHRQIYCAEDSGEMIDNYNVNILVDAQGDTSENSGVMTNIESAKDGLAEKVAELDKE